MEFLVVSWDSRLQTGSVLCAFCLLGSWPLSILDFAYLLIADKTPGLCHGGWRSLFVVRGLCWLVGRFPRAKSFIATLTTSAHGKISGCSRPEPFDRAAPTAPGSPSCTISTECRSSALACRSKSAAAGAQLTRKIAQRQQ